MNFYDRSNLSRHQTVLRTILQERHHIEQFYRAILHAIHLARNN